MSREATWKNGKRTITGTWDYNRAGGFFFISLSSSDPITGIRRQFRVWGDAPEWGSWKLVRRTADMMDEKANARKRDHAQ